VVKLSFEGNIFYPEIADNKDDFPELVSPITAIYGSSI
jgi:hypothetical protein